MNGKIQQSDQHFQFSREKKILQNKFQFHLKKIAGTVNQLMWKVPPVQPI